MLRYPMKCSRTSSVENSARYAVLALDDGVARAILGASTRDCRVRSARTLPVCRERVGDCDQARARKTAITRAPPPIRPEAPRHTRRAPAFHRSSSRAPCVHVAGASSRSVRSTARGPVTTRGLAALDCRFSVRSVFGPDVASLSVRSQLATVRPQTAVRASWLVRGELRSAAAQASRQTAGASCP